MPTATRLATDMSNWAPTTRHYEVDGGYLAVTVNTFMTATGTDVFLADASGGPVSLQTIASFAQVTHDQALELLGYTVVDTIGPEPQPEPTPEPTPQEQSVLDMLPPEIAAVVLPAIEGQ